MKLHTSIVDLAELTMPNENVDITIIGQTQYSLTFTGDIVEIGANRKLRFSDMAQLNGDNMELNGANAELAFESCQYITAYATATLGAFVIIYKSSIFGSTGNKALNIDNVDTNVVVGYSRVQGSAGNPAVEFSVDADAKFKAKFSSFIHGDMDASAPIVNTAAGKVDISVYLCGLNAAWDADKFTNLIGSAGNVTDVNINF